MTRITMIRHGQASILSENYDQLSDLGKEQADLLGEYFAANNIHFDRVVMGPLFRHKQTTEGIQKGYISRNMDFPEIEMMEAFREHQGPAVVRELGPKLHAAGDERAVQIMSMPTETRTDKIRQHLRMFEYITKKWVTGAYDEMASEHQSWADFTQKVLNGIDEIVKTSPNQHVAVVSSGGPVSVLVGNVLGMSQEKIMEMNWMIENSSFSEVHISSKRRSIRNFNCYNHITDSNKISTI